MVLKLQAGDGVRGIQPPRVLRGGAILGGRRSIMKTNAVALERHNLGELAVIEHLADTIGIQAFRHSGIRADVSRLARLPAIDPK